MKLGLWFAVGLFTLSFLSTPLCEAGDKRSSRDAHVRKEVLAALHKDVRQGVQAVSFQVTFLRISGDWAYTDVTPLDRAGKPLAEQMVALLHRVPGRGWKEVDLSKVPTDPNEEEYGDGFARNVQHAFPSAPKEIFRK